MKCAIKIESALEFACDSQGNVLFKSVCQHGYIVDILLNMVASWRPDSQIRRSVSMFGFFLCSGWLPLRWSPLLRNSWRWALSFATVVALRLRPDRRALWLTDQHRFSSALQARGTHAASMEVQCCLCCVCVCVCVSTPQSLWKIHLEMLSCCPCWKGCWRIHQRQSKSSLVL